MGFSVRVEFRCDNWNWRYCPDVSEVRKLADKEIAIPGGWEHIEGVGLLCPTCAKALKDKEGPK